MELLPEHKALMTSQIIKMQFDPVTTQKYDLNDATQ